MITLTYIELIRTPEEKSEEILLTKEFECGTPVLVPRKGDDLELGKETYMVNSVKWAEFEKQEPDIYVYLWKPSK